MATEQTLQRSGALSHLDRLESEAIFIIREAVAEARQPVMLFSAGKDRTVVAHVALRAFHPSGEASTERMVRFRTLGCWPVTATVESEATDRFAIVRETLGSAHSERQGRIGDIEDGGSLEQKKREGYF